MPGYGTISKQTKVWLNHLGTPRRICDMADPELTGTLRMIRRAAMLWRCMKVVEVTDAAVTPTQQAEGLDELAASHWEEHIPELAREGYQAMKLEAQRRHLAWLDGEIPRDMVTDVARLRTIFTAPASKYVAGESRPDRAVELG